MSHHDELSAFGRRLARLRQRKRLTQAELARLAGLSVAIVRALEQGVRSDPRLSTVLKLAAGLGLPVADLAGELGESDDRGSITEVAVREARQAFAQL
jgi:transcriptional regulator with XRE-family HTH domain